MPRAIDLIRDGKFHELWQMCCGFLSLDIDEFMVIQRRLLEQQLRFLNGSKLGQKLMRGANPATVEEFRKVAPLTTYRDYCPELLEKNDDALPVKPAQWVRTSGRSGEYPCKWIPLTPQFIQEMSVVAFGIAVLSTAKDWEDTSQVLHCPRIINAVAPLPYMSGAMAKMMELQSPMKFMPPLDGMDSLTFEQRIQLGFEQALSEGLDGFCGLSLVLVKVGEKISQASNRSSALSYLRKPKAAFRLARGYIRSRLAHRPILPRDLWTVRGIISSGLDSWVYRDKIKELWGRYPLDVYAGSEGGIYATQTWDYQSMTFVPNLNFFEFIPEEERIRLAMDSSYRPRTLLLDEVEPGESYEIVITNFHGGALVRYRPGDIIRITGRRNERLGINIPQMVFEQRADGTLDFNIVRFSEKAIWQALESIGIKYEDWVAYKRPGEQVLNLAVELKDGFHATEESLKQAIYRSLLQTDDDFSRSSTYSNTMDMIGFDLKVQILPRGTFAAYARRKQQAGADLAHLKPPHIQPTEDVLKTLMSAGSSVS
ncbi:MAG: GH3 auxin-responsive promoter family protein [Dehalococcoidales bacterium]|nr:GH3 auxin-responsive promoter family protein [Dehalococcoidales bacterium]